MKILTLKTASAGCEIGFFDNHEQLAYKKWPAGRQLAATILSEIEAMVGSVQNIDGIVYFEGPGSFTGLRISATVANTLAFSLPAKLISSGGDEWLKQGIEKLLAGKSETQVVPKYGQPANITKPIK